MAWKNLKDRKKASLRNEIEANAKAIRDLKSENARLSEDYKVLASEYQVGERVVEKDTGKVFQIICANMVFFEVVSYIGVEFLASHKRKKLFFRGIKRIENGE